MWVGHHRHIIIYHATKKNIGREKQILYKIVLINVVLHRIIELHGRLYRKKQKLSEQLIDLDRKFEAKFSVYKKYNESTKFKKAEKDFKMRSEIITNQIKSLENELSNLDDKYPHFFRRPSRILKT